MLQNNSALAKHITLIPWDPESSSHLHRLVQQRVDCGWNADKVESSWVSLQKQGIKCVYWVAFPENNIEVSNELQSLLNGPLKDGTLLQDTATSIRGLSRTSSGTSFCAIGHISLDTENQSASHLDLGPIPHGSYWISSFFIDHGLQGLGFGRTAMDMVESLATQEPLCAKTLLLDTLHKDDHIRLAIMRDGEEPKTTNQSWYERRNYSVFHVAHNLYRNPDKDGVVHDLCTVFMRRDLG